MTEAYSVELSRVRLRLSETREYHRVDVICRQKVKRSDDDHDIVYKKRVTRELHIDEMKTEWVRVCVRPEQSFTRAILEIYMADGGTLGNIYKNLSLNFQ